MAELALTDWQAAAAGAGTIESPAAVAGLDWMPATVPGTAAGALRAAGAWRLGAAADLDEDDWWFRTRFSATAGAGRLHVGGLATIADVWLNDAHVLHSENMFRSHDLDVELAADNDLVVRCASLRRHLGRRRARPRWKTRLVEDQQLRWVRTTLFGRMPAWTPPVQVIGPWRPVTVTTASEAVVRLRSLRTSVGEDRGAVHVEATLAGGRRPERVELHCAGGVAVLRMAPAGDSTDVDGVLDVADPPRWMPWTHGTPHLFPAELVVVTGGAQSRHPLGRVGFRELTTQRADGAFELACNGVPLFCRGACWMPVDPVDPHSAETDLRSALQQLVGAGANMIRITGNTFYGQDELYDLCDEMGVLVWQDVMLSNMDYPVADEAFAAELTAEVGGVLGALRRHPALAVVCGGSEVEQQAAMMGVEPAVLDSLPGRTVVAEAAATAAPEVPYVSCSPSGGVFPFSVGTGIAHYYGVGAYRRPLDDARRAGVRFASECLAFANIPGEDGLDELWGDGPRVTHDARWKARVPRDRGAPWDFDEVRDHYVAALFGVDPVAVRRFDQDLYLDLGRAAVHDVVEATLAEWRRSGSTCAGALVLCGRDTWPGAGWGIVDSGGRPKSPWYAMARACAPVAVLITDEGLDGLTAHVVNDLPAPLEGSLAMRLFAPGGRLLERRELEVAVGGHGARAVSVDAAFGAFRDINHAFGFGPASYDLVAVDLLDTSGAVISSAHHLVGGRGRPRHDIGLAATSRIVGDSMVVRVTARELAQHVVVECPGAIASDSWFHLPPGDTRAVHLTRPAAPATSWPTPLVRALNSPPVPASLQDVTP